MTRRHRPLAALLAAFALVFAQASAVAHACGLAGASGATEVMAHHAGCHEAGVVDEAPADANACEAHCLYGAASVESTPGAPALPDPDGPALRVAAGDLGQEAGSPPGRDLPLAAQPPPPAILFGVLRI